MRRCPGCGGKPYIENQHHRQYSFICFCGWRGPWCTNEQEAEDLWNRRTVIVDTEKPEKNWAEHENVRKVNDET